MDPQPAVPVALRCPSCGRAVPLYPPTAASTCPYCEGELGLTDELTAAVARLGQRRAEIVAGRLDADETRDNRRRLYGPVTAVLSVGLMVVVLAAAIIPAYLRSRGQLSEQTLNWLAPVGTSVVFCLGFAAIMWWYYKRRRREPPVSTPIVFDAPLSSRAVDQALAEADRELRTVRLARLAEARLTHLEGSSRSAVGSLDVTIIGSLAVPAGLVALWYSIEMARASEPYHPAIWWLWGVPAGGAALLALLRSRRRRRRRLIERGLTPLVRQLHGRRHATYADTIGWLNRHWAAATPDNDQYAGPLHTSTAGTLLGYPVLIDIEPDGLSDVDVTFDPRVVVYLAALLPDRSPPGNSGGNVTLKPNTDDVPSAAAFDAERLRASIAQTGFTVEINPEAGWTARATPQTVTRLRRDLSQLGHLVPVIANLAALAAAEGAAPPPV